MKWPYLIAIFFCWTYIQGCTGHSSDQTNASTPKTGSIEKIDTPRSFVKNYGVKDNNQLFVFVGQKIWVQSIPLPFNSFDHGFKARYAILEKVFGSFPEDTIEFIIYDHYGVPSLSAFENVLLFVSADSGTYYHQKYLYNDVYRTQNGKWAGTYATEDYSHDNNKYTKIKPIKPAFAEPVSYPLKKVTENGDTITRTFPNKYFKTVGDTAFAVYGNYVQELFILKRDGVLTARKIFAQGRLVR